MYSKAGLSLIVSLVCVSCVATPDSGPTIAESAQAGRTRPSVPTQREREEVETIAEERSQLSTPEERWEPPPFETRLSPDRSQRAALRAYLRAVPLTVVPEAQTDAARIYLEHLVTRLGYRSVAEGAGRVRCTSAIESIESTRNYYARAHIRFALESVFGDTVSTTELSGTSVFSPISVYDAGMNSLLRIPVAEFERVIGELVESAITQYERNGLEYRVEGVLHDELEAVLRAVTFPASGSDRRSAFHSPSDLQTVLDRMLDGSPYTVEVHGTTRTIVFSERETRGR